MLKSPNLLNDVYDGWLGNDYSNMENLRQTIDDFKDYKIRSEKTHSEKER